MILKDLGEFNLIKRIARRLKPSCGVIKGIGDDAAVLEYKKDKVLLFTSDMLIEGRHFLKSQPAYLVGKKALSCSVSDIAAMGGSPKSCVISLGVPASLELKYADDLYRGLIAAAGKFKVDIVGGDTVRSEKIIIDVALLGEVRKDELVLRSTARQGHDIFVTGAIGGSFKGRHLTFTPRLKEARFLVSNFKVSSMIDVSDGLAADLGHILESSGVGGVIYEEDVPVSEGSEDFLSAIRDGEDFELIFTASRAEGKKMLGRWPFKTRISRIGRICGGKKGLYVVRKNGVKEKLKQEGYSHF